MYNIYQTLQDTSNRYPEKISIIDEFGTLTYEQLLTQVIDLKEELISQGLKSGTLAGLFTQNNRDFIIGLYAGIATGAVVMPIFHLQKQQEILASIREAKLQVIIGGKQELEKLPYETTCLGGDLSHFSMGRVYDSEPDQLDDRFRNPAFIRFTSGTTGNAKGVVVSHEAVLDRIHAANKALKITTKDVILWVFPMAYHFMVSIVLYIHQAATIVVNNDFLAKEIIHSIRKHQVTFFYCSPLHLKLLVSYPLEEQMASLRNVVSTTTGASKEVCDAFRAKYHLPVHQAFGIIEVGLPIINMHHALENPEAVGLPLPDYDVRIFNEQGDSADISEVGHLGVRGPGMFSGYLRKAADGKEELKNGYFMTGDLASRSNTGIISIKGRDKDVIVVHGNKVFPTEVESVINTFSPIQSSRVFSQPHALFGQIVVAEVVAPRKIKQEELIAYCRKQLSSYKVPQKIMEVSEIEMTRSGKIKRVKN